ncbi:hypothetical protein B0H19DRAFT_1141260 [Mycena capillaripes]|nr:hypothetical protein B0H19DRAFT_1141260 [Mycena capillaripes]
MLKIVLVHFNPDSNPGGDQAIFADFLFCLNSFFLRTTARDCTVLNKSAYTTLLMALLFENLVRRLEDVQPLDDSIANEIVIKVSQIADRIFFREEASEEASEEGPMYRCTNAAYRFCAKPGVSQEAITAALRLVRISGPWELGDLHSNPQALSADSDTTWLSKTLEYVPTLRAHFDLAQDLWQTLFLLPSARDRLSAKSIPVLLSVLSTDPEDPVFDGQEKAAEMIAYCACGFLNTADHWFADNDLRPLLERRQVWANLGAREQITHFTPALGKNYPGTCSGDTSSQTIYLDGSSIGPQSQNPRTCLPTNTAQNFGLFFVACGMQMRPKPKTLTRKQPSSWCSVYWPRHGMRFISQTRGQVKLANI